MVWKHKNHLNFFNITRCVMLSFAILNFPYIMEQLLFLRRGPTNKNFMCPLTSEELVCTRSNSSYSVALVSSCFSKRRSIWKHVKYPLFLIITIQGLPAIKPNKCSLIVERYLQVITVKFPNTHAESERIM